MMSRRTTLLGAGALGATVAGLVAGVLASVRELFGGASSTSAATSESTATSSAAAPPAFEITRTDAEWQQRLSPQQFKVLRQAGTERPGSSPLNREKRAGVFSCAGCALSLFSSTTKFESGTGWPSFWKPLDRAVVEDVDTTLFMKRTEVLCRQCGGHLGHVFSDGPQPTGLRYCMNGVAMNFTVS